MLATLFKNGNSEPSESVNKTTLSKTDIMPGDILLLQYQPDTDPNTEYAKLMGLALQAVKDWQYWSSYSKEKREQQFAKLMPLIQYAITFFDGDSFFHAAIVGTGSDGKNAVFEIGIHGVTRVPLSDYWDGPISVYRYHHGAIALGDFSLPAEPVTTKANAIYDQGDVSYGYFHAGLLAIWCLFRDGEDQIMACLKALLEQTFGSSVASILFAGDGERNLKILLTNVFHAALDHWREKNQLVCSEFVAACFNDADSKGTYRISREVETKSLRRISVHSPYANYFMGLDKEAAVIKMTELSTAIANLQQSQSLRSLSIARDLVETDLLYTPHDLKASISTFHVGDIGTAPT